MYSLNEPDSLRFIRGAAAWAVAGVLLLGGCDTSGEPIATGEVSEAVANISPTRGNDVSGEVRFRPVSDGMLVTGTLAGLQPGRHGFHIHENGDCSAPDASSAGGHFTPHDDPHGAPASAPDKHHVGDLGNIVAGPDGSADIDIRDAELALGEGPNAIIGKAVVIHAEPDDLESQPSGNAGARVACGEIREARPGAYGP